MKKKIFNYVTYFMLVALLLGYGKESFANSGNSTSALSKDVSRTLNKDDVQDSPKNDLPGIGNDGAGEVILKNKPKLIISNYSLDPKMPQAGKSFNLDLTFYNTNNEYSVRNIKISLTNESGAVGPKGESLGGSVFTPVNSSNTFYISRINPQETVSKAIELSIVPNAAAQNYIMNVEFEYEDWKGNQYTAKELIGIPVVQVAKIDSTDIELPPLVMGEEASIEMDFYNTGKDALSNLFVTLESEDLTVNGNPKYFVGNFAPGASDHFSMKAQPNKDGDISGKLVISYEDSTGTIQKQEKAFKANVMGMPEPKLDENGNPILEPGLEEEPGEKNSSSLYIYIIAAIIVLLIVVGLIVWKKRKNKKDSDLQI